MNGNDKHFYDGLAEKACFVNASILFVLIVYEEHLDFELVTQKDQR
jgi:hypothetical protein